MRLSVRIEVAVAVGMEVAATVGMWNDCGWDCRQMQLWFFCTMKVESRNLRIKK